MIFNLLQRLDLRSLNKHVGLQNLPNYYTWRNIRQQYKTNKLKIIAPTWNLNKFELLNGSYSVFRHSRLYRVHHKKHETLATKLPIHIYINRISNSIVFKIKDEYKVQLQIPETMKLLGSTK